MKTRINTRLNSNNFFPQRAGELLSYSWSWIQNPFEGWQPIKNERIKLFWKASICIADTNCWGPNYNRSPSEIFSTQPNPPLKHVVNFSIIYDYYYSYISYMTIIHIYHIWPLFIHISYMTIRKSWNILGFNAKEEKPAVKKKNMRNDCQGKCLQSTIVLSSKNMRNLMNDFQGKCLKSKIVLTSKPNSSFSLCKRTLCDTLINSKPKTSDICNCS